MERSAWKKMPIVMGVVAFGRFASLRKYGPFGEVVIVFNNVRKVPEGMHGELHFGKAVGCTIASYAVNTSFYLRVPFAALIL